MDRPKLPSPFQQKSDRTRLSAACTAVAVHFPRSGAPMYAHEKIALSEVAKSIARLNGYGFVGEYDPQLHVAARLFFIPSDTLMLEEARDLGIHSPDQVYGAVVPYPFVKTKAITHRLVREHAARPHGWSFAFANRVRNAVLPGYTAFSADDAKLAAKRPQALGPVRVKEPLADGGHGQTVIRSIAELEAFLEILPAEKLQSHGLALEANLHRVITRSVGCTIVGGLSIAYHGTQRSVTNNHGLMVYGGSHLICVRGGWTALESLPMERESRLAVHQARTYDRNAARYPGFLATRRNYDVGQGIDGRGQWRSGVLEASWRSGGASTAELAALTAFAEDSRWQAIETASVKHYGKPSNIPLHAAIHFQGDDPEEGPLLRYTTAVRALRQAA